MRRVGGVVLLLLGALALWPVAPMLFVGVSLDEVRCGINLLSSSIVIVASTISVLLGFSGLIVLRPDFLKGRRRPVLLGVFVLAALALAWLWLWVRHCPFPSR